MKKELVQIKLNKEEKEQLKNIAKEKNISLSEYLLLAGLQSEEKELVKIENKIIKEVTKINNTIQIETDDIFNLYAELKEIRERIDSISRIILKTEKAYPQDLKKIQDELCKIEDSISKNTITAMKNRKEIRKVAQDILDNQEEL